MSTQPVTLDMSTAQPIQQPVTLDMSTAQPINAPQTAPDLRPQRVNQRTGQPTSIEDPEGVDRIAADPDFAKHTAEGAGQAALATGSAFAAPFADPVLAGVVSHLKALKSILGAARDLGLTGMGLNDAYDLYEKVSKRLKK